MHIYEMDWDRVLPASPSEKVNIIQSYLRVLPGCFATDSGFHRELKTQI